MIPAPRADTEKWESRMSEYSADIIAAILEALPNGVYVVDRMRRIQFWNKGAEQISGFLRQEVMGRLCADDLLSHCTIDGVSCCGAACPLQETMHDGKPREMWAYLRHKGGHRVPVRVRSIPVRDASGAIVGAAETFDEQLHPDATPRPHNPTGPTAVDPLTGIPDHHAILGDVFSSLSDYSETEIPFGALGIAIDHLDDFSRSHGRRGADAMLHIVAATLVKNLPPEDRFGRWTNDRFVVVVEHCSLAALATIAERLARVIEMDELPWWGDRLPVSVTIGGTVVRHGDTAHVLVKRMEQALAEAEPGRGRNVKIVG
jgi:diguanylate cyclase (GGDEF)-like protein/PAS domain S-box-containing protein